MPLTRSSRGRRGPFVKRILVATDRSETADRAVEWAAEMADRYDSELVLLQVLGDGSGEDAHRVAVSGLAKLSEQIAAPRTRLQVVVDSDPSRAIVHVAEEESVDVLVVGSIGMSGRKEFLLGNVPNRISHNARCTVIIVNTFAPNGEGVAARAGASVIRGHAAPETEPRLTARGTHIGAVMAKHGLRELFGRPDESGAT